MVIQSLSKKDLTNSSFKNLLMLIEQLHTLYFLVLLNANEYDISKVLAIIKQSLGNFLDSEA
jgi:hypothetical protein